MNYSDRKKEDIIKELEALHAEILQAENCNDELRKYKDKLEKLLDSSPDALVFVNDESSIIMVNAQFEKLFGYGPDEIVHKSLDILIPERFRGKHKDFVQSFFHNPATRPMGTSLEIYALRKDGEEFPADIGLSLLKTEDEFFVSAAIRDITKRKEIEKQMELDYFLQKELNAMLEISLEPVPPEEQFKKILDLILSMPYLALQKKGAIYIAENSSNTLVLKASNGFESSSQMPCRDIPFGTCLCGEAASSGKIVFSDQVNGSHTIHHEGIFPHGHYCVPILSGGSTIGVINIFLKEGHKRSSREEQFLTAVANTLAMIIKHKRIEVEKDQLQEQLTQTETLAALGRFTANVAHEIRNPLTAIGGFARRLGNRVREGTKEKEYAGFITSEVTILEKILNKVLTYSRARPHERVETDINEIVESLLKLNEEGLHEKGITVHKSLAQLPLLSLDKTEIHESLENIIVNAIDSMPDGGELTITTDRNEIEAVSHAYIKIQDTGTGMDPEQLQMIFEPFYTTKIIEKGTGLGLPITKKIVEEHGGFITVESEKGKGSTFVLHFPIKVT